MLTVLANQPHHTSFSIWHSYCYCYIAKKHCSFNMPFDLNDGWKREIFIWHILFVSLFILTVARNRSDLRNVYCKDYGTRQLSTNSMLKCLIVLGNKCQKWKRITFTKCNDRLKVVSLNFKDIYRSKYRETDD